MRTNIAWTTDTGTAELPRTVKGVPLADLETTELLVPLKPSVAPDEETDLFYRFRRPIAAVTALGMAAVTAVSLLAVHGAVAAVVAR